VRIAYGSSLQVEPHKYAERPARYLTYWIKPRERGVTFETNSNKRVEAIHAARARGATLLPVTEAFVRAPTARTNLLDGVDEDSQNCHVPIGRDTSGATAAWRVQADERAECLRPVVERLQAEGITSGSALASELNRRGVATPRGGRWQAASVAILLRRLAVLQPQRMSHNVADHSGAPWTAEEIAQLHKLAREGLDASAIAIAMRRTRAGIVKKADSERLSLDPNKRP
jgi:hypothetical protein